VPWPTPHSGAAVGGREEGIGQSECGCRREPAMPPTCTTTCSTGGFCRKPVRWGSGSNYIRIQPSPGRSSLYQMSSLQCFTHWKDFVQGE